MQPLEYDMDWSTMNVCKEFADWHNTWGAEDEYGDYDVPKWNGSKEMILIWEGEC